MVEALNADNKVIASATTDDEGTYMFSLEPGSYTIQANGLYYETAKITEEISKGETLSKISL